MAAAPQYVHMRIEVTNLKAVRALALACKVLEDAQESAPWNAEINRAVRALHYAKRHLRPRAE